MKLSNLSILITSYNKSQFLNDFQSLLKDLLSLGAEIVIVDDNSTDDSAEILSKMVLEMHAITLITNPENRGSAASRNHALSLATRPYVCFLDIDDRLIVPVLVEMCQYAEVNNLDLVRASYSNLETPNLPVSEDFLDVGIYELSDLSQTLARNLGYWRFIYSRSFLTESNVKFLPTRKDLKSRHFILDDLFWLIAVFSLRGKIGILPRDKISYIYTSTTHTLSSWKTFRRQAMMIPKASLFCLDFYINNPYISMTTLKLLLLNKSLGHMQYLKITELIFALPNFLILSHRCEINRNAQLNSLKQIISLLKRALKNSIYPLFFRAKS